MDSTPLAGDLIFDVGLHRGEDSAYYMSKGFRVVAFEANPELVAHCRKRFAKELATGAMTIIAGAIDDEDREAVTFFVHPGVSVWGTTDEGWAQRNALRGRRSQPIEVPAVDFAGTIRSFGVPYYMKIDVEGADRVCLDALRQFEKRPNYLSIESEKVDWTKLEAEFDVLQDLGYRRFAVCQQAGLEKREIVTRTRAGGSLTYRFEKGASGPFGEDIAEPWTDRQAALAHYARIFQRYRLFGDDSVMGRTRPGRVLRRVLSDVLRRPVPGWYDTHASLE